MKRIRIGMKRKLPVLLPLIAVVSGVAIILCLLQLLFPKSNIPTFNGTLIVELNDNYPDFTVREITLDAYDTYSELDMLGRAGVAMACLHKDLLPDEPRHSISGLEPSGWKNENGIYNRSHLIANQLTGKDTVENLVTGTSYLNVEGMLPYENRVSIYVKNTNNHVMYRVSPHYDGTNLVPTAVQIEAYSVEDCGKGICCNVLIYNVQPGFRINYLTGSSKEDPRVKVNIPEIKQDPLQERVIELPSATEPLQETVENEEQAITYIINTNTMRFHYIYCDSVTDMKEKNRQEFYGSREEAIAQGYKPCGACCP